MKVNLKTTNETENAAATPNCHQRGQRTVNGIIGNTSRGIVVDQTLDPDSNNPVSNKPVSTALAALAGKIDAALQKPTGLTKTKLVGVGTNGQENIEIGDNLTLANGKLSATGGGGGIPVVEGTVNESGDTITIPSAQTTNFILHTEDFGYVFMNNIPEYGYQSSFVFEYQGSYITYSLIGTETTINLKLTLVPLATINGTYDSTQNKITLDTESNNPFILSVNGLGKFFINVLQDGIYYSVVNISQDDTSINELTITLLHGINTTINVIKYKISNTITDTNILPLPNDASTSTYVLKAVNGTVQWVKES